MATTSVTVTATLCAGQHHAHVVLTGAKTGSEDVDVGFFTEAITNDEIYAFVRVVCKMARAGRNNAQTIALLAAGVTVTV